MVLSGQEHGFTSDQLRIRRKRGGAAVSLNILSLGLSQRADLTSGDRMTIGLRGIQLKDNPQVSRLLDRHLNSINLNAILRCQVRNIGHGLDRTRRAIFGRGAIDGQLLSGHEATIIEALITDERFPTRAGHG
jgi:hypothetical protein